VEIFGRQGGRVPITIDFSLKPIRGESGEAPVVDLMEALKRSLKSAAPTSAKNPDQSGMSKKKAKRHKAA
jgi:non-homologous end joining protein Ku